MSAAKRVEQIAGHLNYPKGMLVGQVAIVTGSGQGIGAETARLFANEGARVVISDIDASKLSRPRLRDYPAPQGVPRKLTTNRSQGERGCCQDQIRRRKSDCYCWGHAR